MKNCALNNVSSSLNPSSAIQDRLIGRDNDDGISDFLYCFPEKHILIFTAILLELFSDILQCYKSVHQSKMSLWIVKKSSSFMVAVELHDFVLILRMKVIGPACSFYQIM